MVLECTSTFLCSIITLADYFTLSSLRRPSFCIDKKRGKNDLRGCTP